MPHVHFDGIACLVSFLGGVLIALVTSGFLLCTGTVTGISGVMHGLIRPWGTELLPWKGCFLFGLFVSGFFYYALPEDVRFVAFGPPVFPLRLWVCIVSGIMVGWGASLANGCTSGHGLCGVARLSPRSLVFTAMFFALGIIVASVTRASFAYDVFYAAPGTADFDLGAYYVLPLLGVFVLQVIVCLSRGREWWSKGLTLSQSWSNWQLQVVSLLGGFLFGVALILTGMSNALKVLDFLDFLGEPDGWDPQLLFCCAGAMGMNLVMFNILHRRQQPPLLSLEAKPLAQYINYGLCPANRNIDCKLITGALLFGIGWGLTGICPGPAAVNYVTGRGYFGVLLPSMILGMQIDDAVGALRESYSDRHADATEDENAMTKPEVKDVAKA